jgi:hypothetical protein
MSYWFKLSQDYDTDSSVLCMEMEGRVTFLWLLMACSKHGDDRGRVPANEVAPRVLARRIGFSEEQAIAGVAQAVAVGIVANNADGSLTICDWFDWQVKGSERQRKRDSRSASRPVPSVPVIVADSHGQSRTDCDGHGTVRDPSPLYDLGSESESSPGEKSEGGEKRKTKPKQPTIGPDADPRIKSVWDAWLSERGRIGRKTPVGWQEKYGRRISDRLAEGWSTPALTAAVKGCFRTPHNLGFDDAGNPTGKQFLDLELICRSGAQVERFAISALRLGAELTDEERSAVSEVGLDRTTAVALPSPRMTHAQAEWERDKFSQSRAAWGDGTPLTPAQVAWEKDRQARIARGDTSPLPELPE